MAAISFTRSCRLLVHLSLVLLVSAPAVEGQSTGPIALPTSKQLVEPVPGGPQRLNSLPMTAAISPDGRYLAVVNAGYGTSIDVVCARQEWLRVGARSDTCWALFPSLKQGQAHIKVLHQQSAEPLI